MSKPCAHSDYRGGMTWVKCSRPAQRKSIRSQHWADDDPRAIWYCRKHWYAEYLKSSHWERLRERKLRTVSWQCERCGRRAHRTMKGNRAGLNVHHRTYERVGGESLEDLEVLCEACHRGEHGIA